MKIRNATIKDLNQIYHLYKSTAEKFPGTLTQEAHEVTESYVREMILASLERGAALVMEKETGEIIGFMKAFTSKFKCLAHVLSDATLMISPKYAGTGVGYGAKLFDAFTKNIAKTMPHIKRFEIFPHDANERAIRIYIKLGYQVEKIAKDRILNIDGQFGNEVCLTWVNPNFDIHSLHKYHEYLLNKVVKKKIKPISLKLISTIMLGFSILYEPLQLYLNTIGVLA